MILFFFWLFYSRWWFGVPVVQQILYEPKVVLLESLGTDFLGKVDDGAGGHTARFVAEDCGKEGLE